MRGGSRAGLALGAVGAVTLPALALAATLTVNTTANNTTGADGLCTLREALNNANADLDTTTADCLPGSGADVIVVPAGTYLLTSALSVTDDVTLQGAGASQTTLDAQGTSGVLAIQQNAGVVRIEGVTLRRGGMVGALNNHGATLTLVDSVVADSTGVPAGGITSYNGVTTLERSLVRGNQGPTSCGTNSAGGISVFDGTVRILNSTISGNSGRCGSSGSALHVGASVDAVEILFSTIAENTCSGSCHAIVTDAAPAVTRARASLFETSAATGTPPSNCDNALTSLGYNLASDATCELEDETDLPVPVAPDTVKIGSLKNNGGPATHALRTGSPAIDAIPLEACGFDDDGVPETPELAVTTDQRGQPRPAASGGEACDVGAYEGTYVNSAPLAVCTNPSVNSGVGTCNASASVDGGSSDPNGDTLTFTQEPAGPYEPGTTPVTLHVTDNDPDAPAEDTCEALVTVTDNRAPVISCPTAAVKRPKKGLLHNFGVPATDNCGSPSFSVDPDYQCFSIKKGKKGEPDVHVPEDCTIETDSLGVHVTIFPRKKSTMVWTIDAEDENGNTASKECTALAK